MIAKTWISTAFLFLSCAHGIWSVPADAMVGKDKFEPVLCGRVTIDEELAAHLMVRGTDAKANSEDELLLRSGCLVLAPHNRLHVQSDQAKVGIAGGAIVCIKNAGNGTSAVLNLHDNRRGAVVIRLYDHEYELPPGRMVVLTNNMQARFDDVNPFPGLWYRSVYEMRITAELRLLQTQFSLPSASYVIPTVRHLTLHDRRLGQKMLKTMTAVWTASRDPSPFRPFTSHDDTLQALHASAGRGAAIVGTGLQPAYGSATAVSNDNTPPPAPPSAVTAGRPPGGPAARPGNAAAATTATAAIRGGAIPPVMGRIN